MPARSPHSDAVSAPGLTYRLLDGAQAAEHADELQALHAEVYAEPPYGRNDDAAHFTDRLRVQRRQPGFVLLRLAMAAFWSATQPGCRSDLPPPGGET